MKGKKMGLDVWILSINLKWKSSEFSYHFSETPFPGLAGADLRRGERESSLRGWEREQTSILEGQNNNYESMTEQKTAETGHQKDCTPKSKQKLTQSVWVLYSKKR